MSEGRHFTNETRRYWHHPCNRVIPGTLCPHGGHMLPELSLLQEDHRRRGVLQFREIPVLPRPSDLEHNKAVLVRFWPWFGHFQVTVFKMVVVVPFQLDSSEYLSCIRPCVAIVGGGLRVHHGDRVSDDKLSFSHFLSFSLFFSFSVSQSLSLFLSLSLSLFLSLSPFLYISLFLSLPLSFSLSLSLFLPLFISLSLCRSLPLSVFLLFSLSLSLSYC